MAVGCVGGLGLAMLGGGIASSACEHRSERTYAIFSGICALAVSAAGGALLGRSVMILSGNLTYVQSISVVFAVVFALKSIHKAFFSVPPKPLSIEEQIENLFRSTTACMSVFVIEGQRVRVAFNPNGPPVQSFPIEMGKGVIIAPETGSLSEDVEALLRDRIPDGMSSVFCNAYSTFNGKPAWEYMGL